MQTTPRRADATPTEPPAPSPFFRYRFANVDFDESVGTLSVGGVIVVIEPRPRELLSELLRRSNEVVAREELMEAHWQGRPTVDNVLANAVTKLRKALGAEGAERLINVPRVGYRLAGPIERVAVGQHVGDLPLFVVGERVPGRETYRLEAPLGRSAATALVWRARDPKLQETRIFKFAADGERLTALKREYTLYRVLRAELGDRDDFARVLGANFATAPYFIECEDGGPDLLTWADEGDRLAKLATAERLDLFLKIARAVAAAHGVGVLHKDLKPANVLVASVGDGWQAKLTDFGSSRLLDLGRLAALGVTAMGLTVTHGIGSDSPGGTPLYLAPELIAGRSPTTQSDLFALGLMLYQMVVGDLRRPMSTGWQREIDDGLLAADIAAATEGRPQDRLGSVAELVERLQTLERRRAAEAEAHEAVRRADALAAEAERRRSRRPWVVAALMALSVGMATSLWFFLEARNALQNAQQESARANAINGFLTEDVLQSPEMLLVGGSKVPTLLDVLRRAAERVGERFKGQPLLESAARQHLARMFRRIVSTTDAFVQYKAAVDVLKPRVPPGDPQLLGLMYEEVGLLQRDVKNPKEANALFAAAQRATPPGRELENTALAFFAARAAVEVMPEKPDAAALDAAVRLKRLAVTTVGIDDAMRLEARLLLAQMKLRLGNRTEADALVRDLNLPVPQAEAVRAVTFAIHDMWTIAPAAHEARRYPQAEALLLQVIDRLAASPIPSQLHLAYARAELGSVDYDWGSFEKAADQYRQSAEAFVKVLGPDHQSSRITLINIAAALNEQGRFLDAYKILLDNDAWFKVHAARGFYIGFEWALDQALIGLKRPSEALARLDALPPNSDDTEREWTRGFALIALGRTAEGRTLVQGALASLRNVATPQWLIDRLESALDASKSSGR